jgi:hypothetical protein
MENCCIEHARFGEPLTGKSPTFEVMTDSDVTQKNLMDAIQKAFVEGTLSSTIPSTISTASRKSTMTHCGSEFFDQRAVLPPRRGDVGAGPP